MSHRIINTPRFEIVAGWDNILCCHFLTIRYQEFDELLVCNSFLKDPGISLTEMELLINSFGIEPEALFWDRLKSDRAENVGSDAQEFTFRLVS